MTVRTTAMAAAAALALCLTATACGGSDTKAQDAKAGDIKGQDAKAGGAGPRRKQDGAAPAPAERPVSSGRTLSGAELAKLVLATGDVPDFEVSAPGGGQEADREAGREKADKRECQPIADVINGTPDPAAVGSVHRVLVDGSEEGRDDQTVVTEFLSAHRAGAARSVLRALSAAVERCGSGFTTSGGDGAATYAEVKRLPAPRAGEESIAYQVTGALSGQRVPLVFHLVRHGSTLATFHTANFMDARTPELPAPLATAQVAKLP